ncbi:MAG: hypothetical protein ABIH53_05025 [archaeon]
MNSRLAYLLGAYLGDGCLTTKGHYSNLVFKILSIDEDLLKRIKSILLIDFDSCITIQSVKRYFAITSEKQDLVDFLDYWSGRNKNWPNGVSTWSIESKKEFFAGLLDTDGYSVYQENKLIQGAYYDQCRIGFCSTSDWIEEVKRLGQSLGIRIGKIWISNDGKKNGHKGDKIVRAFNVNVKDFIQNKCYFRVGRKQKKIVRYAQKYSLLYPHRPYAEHN